MTSVSVSARVAQILARNLTDVFGVMGNGNVYFLDGAEQYGLKFTAVRHEGAAIAAADAYFRASGHLAAATTTYGLGYTNTLTALAEAVQARIPVILVSLRQEPEAWCDDRSEEISRAELASPGGRKSVGPAGNDILARGYPRDGVRISLADTATSDRVLAVLHDPSHFSAEGAVNSAILRKVCPAKPPAGENAHP